MAQVLIGLVQQYDEHVLRTQSDLLARAIWIERERPSRAFCDEIISDLGAGETRRLDIEMDLAEVAADAIPDWPSRKAVEEARHALREVEQTFQEFAAALTTAHGAMGKLTAGYSQSWHGFSGQYHRHAMRSARSLQRHARLRPKTTMRDLPNPKSWEAFEVSRLAGVLVWDPFMHLRWMWLSISDNRKWLKKKFGRGRPKEEWLERTAFSVAWLIYSVRRADGFNDALPGKRNGGLAVVERILSELLHSRNISHARVYDLAREATARVRRFIEMPDERLSDRDGSIAEMAHFGRWTLEYLPKHSTSEHNALNDGPTGKTPSRQDRRQSLLYELSDRMGFIVPPDDRTDAALGQKLSGS